MSATRQTTGNIFGEIKGSGPPWACAEHGDSGHNGNTCITCLGNFMTRNNDNDPLEPKGATI